MRYLGSTNTLVAAVGHAAGEIRLGSWCEPLGYASDYFGIIREHEFGVCPAFWGTGAQIKQYEFAELGMPIVAYRWMVDPDLWVDGENCFLVDDPYAFAERLCSIGSSRQMAQMRERAKLLNGCVAERLERQYAELDGRLGLRGAAGNA
jgi:glycosyltransferase involved in cell wall biosynthesis